MIVVGVVVMGLDQGGIPREARPPVIDTLRMRIVLVRRMRGIVGVSGGEVKGNPGIGIAAIIIIPEQKDPGKDRERKSGREEREEGRCTSHPSSPFIP